MAQCGSCPFTKGTVSDVGRSHSVILDQQLLSVMDVVLDMGIQSQKARVTLASPCSKACLRLQAKPKA